MLKIIIENEKSAMLEITSPEADFGIYKAGNNAFKLGIKDNPVFYIEQSLSEERLFIDLVTPCKPVENENICFNEDVMKWLADSCCCDFSILNHLPSGNYRLVKTSRKPRPSDTVLMGNEWAESPENIVCFTGSEKNLVIPAQQVRQAVKRQYYSMIIGCEYNSPPSVSLPLISVIIPDYGMVWEGATGFVFFSFKNDEVHVAPEKDILLVIPYSTDFIIQPLNNTKPDTGTVIRDIESFVRII